MPFGPSSATVTTVAASASAVTLFSANSSSLHGRFVYNDSAANLYLKFGSAASTSNFTVKLRPEAYYEFPNPVYRGLVTGIWTSATGSAQTTESPWSSAD